ncbi:mitochondrial single stranded DNA-binding protein [Megalopta genalis]|uniref:mitochondrial single stranded DNA-binding protein n=1 Tax=Megalopta genalis TaxID=115081 RepID=UPI00144317DE|nr:single-stranded DNA-binding protein, mitochondrial [Megalopta genalis]XP_033338011.1 single-stranded DNA-binding protein, mitochondrial [Megalopta genalis]
MFQNVISKRLPSILGIYNKQMCTQVKLEKTINQITVLGRVGADPQKKGSDDHPMITFSLATHNNYKYDNGDFMQKTDWHKICVFKPLLRDTVLNFLKRGQRVMVMGKISYSEYKDQEGLTRNGTAIIADEIIFFQKS